MRPWRSRQGRGAALLSVIGLVLAYFATSYGGTPTADLHLNDGGIWVLGPDQRVGRLNYYAHELDAAVEVPQELRDIRQHDDTVVAQVAEGFRVLDPGRVSLGDIVRTTPGSEIHLGGDAAAVLDRAAGSLWALPARTLRGFDANRPATIAKAPGLLATVGIDGSVFALAPDGQITTMHPAADTARAAAGRLTDYPNPAKAVLTAVGQTPAAYDPDSGRLWLPGRAPVTLEKNLVLQEPGPQAPHVRLAGPAALVTVPLVDGAARTTPVAAGKAGKPAPPVVVGSCTYAAWATSGGYLRDCSDDTADRNTTQPALARATELRFRVNHGLVALNDLGSGAVLFVDDAVTVIDDWQRFQSDGQGGEDGKPVDEPDEDPQPDDVNDPPVAHDDDFGVRAGKAVTLDVLADDTDPDGDILTVEPVGRLPARFGRVAPIRAGEALQVVVDEGASGTATFKYAVADGRGGTAQASVTLTVHGPERGGPPEPLREPRSILLTPGGSGSYYVLPDWVDPDGDDMWISADTVSPAPKGLDVDVRQDGLVTVRDLGGESGERQVPIVVQDSRGQRTETVVRVTMAKNTDHDPVPVPDHRRVLVGQAVDVSPIDNDTDPDGDELSLAAVDGAGADTTVTPNLPANRFAFSADKPGSYRLPYVVTDGPNKATSFVRIDVVEPVKSGVPAAEPDIALLPAGASVLVDVLANDFDPQGGVLVIRSVAAAEDLTVEVVEHARLRVSAPGGLTSVATVTYEVSNGPAHATGTVTVLQAPGAATVPPEAVDDEASVRTGDLVNVDVTANDELVPGSPVRVDPTVRVISGEGRGEFFVTGNLVRFKAGSGAGRVRGTYTIRDERDQFASATVTIDVHDAKSGNAPPAPKPLTARMIAGTTVTIPVPTDRIDPDGDSASLVALAKAPAKGTVLIEGGALVYTAPASPPGQVGTDQFSYEVVDQLGLRGTGTVEVGIAKPPEVNQTPVAVADNVKVRPGTEIAIPILANDFDSDGDPLRLVAGSLKPVSSATRVPVSEIDGFAQLTTPAAQTRLNYYYDIVDPKGARSRGAITVDVDPDAETVPPLAHDDFVSLADVQGKSEVGVDVLANDEDPDGVPKQLVVSTAEPGVRAAEGSLTIPVTEKRQLVIYTVTDTDDHVSSAIVIVPGVPRPVPGEAPEDTDRTPPRLRTDKVPVRVTAGESVRLALSDYVQVRAGRSPHVTNARTVSAVGANATAVSDDRASVTYTAGQTFSGPGSISFEVTDAKGSRDDTALTALLSIPIQVTGVRNIAPTFQGTAVTLQAGATTTLPLRPLVSDPDPGDQDQLRFDMVGSRGAVQASIVDGSTLSLRADQDARTGRASVDLTVSDGTNRPVRATILVNLVAVDKPLMTVTPAVFPDVDGPVTVDITDYVTNPFADEGGTIRLVGPPRVETPGSGTATGSGTTIVVTPADTFHGTMRVSYRVEDQTGDPARQVTGTIELTVIGRPDPPTAVTARSDAPETALVSWTPGANNGSPISEFEVFWSGGGDSQSCGLVTSCRIDGLTNGVEYRFTVRATNARGPSADSAPSNPVTPKDVPDTPQAPTAEPGDGSVTLSWPVPGTGGGDITRYTVQISPGGGTRTATTNSLTWPGLTNGDAYRFRVMASGDGGDSDYSEYSAAVIPAGPPGAPGNVRASVASVGGDPVATVTWSAADGNGATPDSYSVYRTGSGTPLFTGNALTAEIRLAVSEDPVTFTVQAHNEHGNGPMSKPSNPVRAYTAPGAPTNVRATPTGADNTVTISFTPGASNGAQPNELTYYWRVGSVRQSLPAGGGTVTSSAFPNGRDVSLVVYAVARIGTSGSVPSPDSDPATVNAYGPPRAPKVSAVAQSDGVLLSWDATDSANGRPIETVLVWTTYSRDSKQPLTGSVLEGKPGETIQIYASARDSEGHESPRSETASAQVPALPGSWDLERGNPPADPAACGSRPDCFYVTLKLSGWAANATVICKVPAMSWTITRVVNGAGYSPASSIADGGQAMIAWDDSPLAYGVNSSSVSCL